MKRIVLPLIAVLLLAGCAGPEQGGDPGQSGGGSDSNFEPSALGLVNLWRVGDAQGETADTWLRLDGRELQLWRECGMVQGSWVASDTLFLGELWGGSPECDTSAEWLTQAAAFVPNATGYELHDGSGAVVASLSVDGAPKPIDSVSDVYTTAPEITDELREQFVEAAPLAEGFTPIASDDILGRWLAQGLAVSTEPFVTFAADGSWEGSDGCNGARGRWVVGADGSFLSTSGPQTLIGCEGAAIPGWVSLATSAGVDATGALSLFGSAGALNGVLSR